MGKWTVKRAAWKNISILITTCQQLSKLHFSTPKMSDFLILNWGWWLTRTEQLTNCGLKKGINYTIINFMTSRLTKVKLLNIISFLPFLTQIKQKFGPNVLKIWYFQLLTLTQFISDNNNRITQMWLKYNYTFTITNEIKITHFTIQVIDEAFCS